MLKFGAQSHGGPKIMTPGSYTMHVAQYSHIKFCTVHKNRALHISKLINVYYVVLWGSFCPAW